MQIADADDLRWHCSGYAEVAEVGWSDTTNTLPDHQGRLEDYKNVIFHPCAQKPPVDGYVPNLV